MIIRFGRPTHSTYLNGKSGAYGRSEDLIEIKGSSY